MSARPRVTHPGLKLYIRPVAETKAFPVVDGLWALRLPVPYYPDLTVNAYLVRLERGWALVDCGSSLPPGYEGVAHAMAQAGVAPEELELLVCTHTHSDHYGCAQTFRERLGIPLALPPGTPFVIDRMRDPNTSWDERFERIVRAGVPEDLRELMIEHPGGDGRHVQPPADRPLALGDVLETAVGSFRVVPTSGHAPNQVAFVEEERGLAFTADLLFARRLPYLHLGADDEDMWADQLASLDRIEAFGLDLLLPGHGSPLRGEKVAAAIESTRQTFANAPDLILERLRTRPLTAWEVVAEAIDVVDPFEIRQTSLVGTLTLLRRLRQHGAIELADVDADGAERWRAA